MLSKTIGMKSFISLIIWKRILLTKNKTQKHHNQFQFLLIYLTSLQHNNQGIDIKVFETDFNENMVR